MLVYSTFGATGGALGTLEALERGKEKVYELLLNNHFSFSFQYLL